MMRANLERVYDEYERKANEAIILANAINSTKKVKSTDLFKRPVDDGTARRKTEDLLGKADHASEWLSQFEQFKDFRKEDVNG